MAAASRSSRALWELAREPDGGVYVGRRISDSLLEEGKKQNEVQRISV